MPLSKRVYALRKARGYTQAKLAAECGLTLQSIWRYEHDGAKPSADTLPRLARALGVTVSDLLVDESEAAQ